MTPNQPIHKHYSPKEQVTLDWLDFFIKGVIIFTIGLGIIFLGPPIVTFLLHLPSWL